MVPTVVTDKPSLVSVADPCLRFEFWATSTLETAYRERVDLSPAARILLRHMATKRPQLDVATAVQETDLTAGVIGNALVALHDANLVAQFMQPSDEGPEPTGIYRLTAEGRRIAQHLTD